ncbi:hypothetical protein BDV37DRAFT_266759 [Aspergillus pseudonomiae]|uniref:Secreted protein n=1 Tax=Aspergillus pseudonomiae TaxID=1506151 RepID=A0A5N7CSX3_9EURO|nr:uncharacterized protein BDV37DRAFT_266759 [Aspergillus pseudonomiae]KAE8397049.1 hypothetical protein BDV37DRAFT_266759 [Aspergillus pseudonomiae]
MYGFPWWRHNTCTVLVSALPYTAGTKSQPCMMLNCSIIVSSSSIQCITGQCHDRNTYVHRARRSDTCMSTMYVPTQSRYLVTRGFPGSISGPHSEENWRPWPSPEYRTRE